MNLEAQKIARKIERLRREFSMLPTLESRHNPLEIEEYQHYLLELEELLIVLKYLMEKGDETPAMESDSEPEVQLDEQVAPVSESEDEVEEEVIEEPSSEKEEEVIEEETPQPQNDLQEIEEPEVQAPIDESLNEVPELIATGESVNDVVGAGDDSLATKLSKRPIADLKEAFGLNERFLYANELFGGDGQEFIRALNELNHLSNFEDAKRMIEARYQSNFNWNIEDDNVLSFMDIVERRYL